MADDKKPKIPPLPPQRLVPPRPPQGATVNPKAGLPPLTARPAAPLRPPAPAVKPPQADQGSVKSIPGGMPQVSGEVDEMRKQMESQISGLQSQLQEEKEKLLMQTVRAKEEEAMAAKVEESLKDIQDRLRREKREQELQDALSKSELQLKELEQRLSAERQTWVETLKGQVNQRESQDKELEHDFDLKLKELERRWHEEKLSWSQAFRNKDEEIARLKRETETAITNEKNSSEKRITQLEAERDAFRRELKEIVDLRDQERVMNASKLESRDKEFLSIKAQQAMVITQLRQEKEKEDQLRALLEKMRAEKNAMSEHIDSKDKEYFMLKTQFALYQTRAKTEQEKLLREMHLFKEQFQKERDHWEVNFRAKENELKMYSDNAKEREAALKQAVERKELEAAASAREADEKFRSRETEIRYILEKKDAEIKAASQADNERIAALEQSHGQLMAQKDREAKEAQVQWIEKMQAKDKELSMFADREQGLRGHISQLEQKVSQLEEKLRYEAEAVSKEHERSAQKEAELRNALSGEQEKLRNTTRELSEALARQQSAALELAKKDNDLTQSKADIDARAREMEALARDNDAKSKEISTLAEKQRDLTSNQFRLEHAANAFSDKLALAEQGLRIKNDELRDKNTEILRLQEKFNLALEQAKKEASDKLTQEENRLKAQLDAARDEAKNSLNLKELEIRDLRNEKENLKAEATKISIGIMSKEKEISDLRNDMLGREKEAKFEIERREGVFNNEKRSLADKIRVLEDALCDAQNNSSIDAQRLERAWKEKEEVFSVERRHKDEIITSLKAEKENLVNEKEKLSEQKSQAEDTNQAELMSVQRKLWENKERFSEQIKEKEREITELKDYQNAVEERVKRELHAKYGAKIEELERENQSLSRDVTGEVKDLRSSLQAELKKREEQQNIERLSWELKLRGKDETISNLMKQIESFNNSLQEKDLKVAAQEFREALKTQFSAQGGEESEKTLVLNKEKNAFERTAIIEPSSNAAGSAAGSPAKKYSLFALLAYLWRSMNEPVIVIGSGKNDIKKG